VLGRGKLLIVTLAGFVLLGPFARTVLAHGNPVWREYSYLGSMDAIALGCLTALFLQGRSMARATNRILAGCGIALLALCLIFGPVADALRLEKFGVDMTVVAVGACMVIAAAASSRWQAPRILSFPLLYGRRSYEIYLTHMFVVLACFAVFREAGRSLTLAVPLLIAIFALAAGLGEIVARFYSEPANRALRARFGDAPGRLGSVVETKLHANQETHV
jgi:peptidoglycan/LPS O-acetylase OafA/YrhL